MMGLPPVRFNNNYMINHNMPPFTGDTNLLDMSSNVYPNQQLIIQTQQPVATVVKKGISKDLKILGGIALVAVAVWQRKNIGKVFKQVFGNAEKNISKAVPKTQLPVAPKSEVPKINLEPPKAQPKVETITPQSKVEMPEVNAEIPKSQPTIKPQVQERVKVETPSTQTKVEGLTQPQAEVSAIKPKNETKLGQTTASSSTKIEPKINKINYEELSYTELKNINNPRYFRENNISELEQTRIHSVFQNKRVILEDNFKKMSDNELKILYSEALNNNGKVSVENYRFLKNEMDKRFTIMPQITKNTAVKLHHELNGMNLTIRNEVELGKISPLTKEIDEAFSKLPPLEKDCIVYRGRREHPVCKSFNKDYNIIENGKIGSTIVPDTAFSYTAMHRNMAENWANGYGVRNMMYEIKIPKGAKVSRNLEHTGEIIMPRGAQYKLVSKKVDPEGVINVQLEYILPKI